MTTTMTRRLFLLLSTAAAFVRPLLSPWKPVGEAAAAQTQDWPTRRSQPGVVLAVKAGEKLVTPGPPGSAVWADDTSASGIDFWKKGPHPSDNNENYWLYWASAMPTYPDSYDSLTMDRTIKTSGAGSFRWVYPGNPQSHDQAVSTYRMLLQYTGPPLYPQQRQHVKDQDWPVQFDALYPSAEWDRGANPSLPWNHPSQPASVRTNPQSAGKTRFGNEFYVQARMRYGTRYCYAYAKESTKIPITKASWDPRSKIVTLSTAPTPHNCAVNSAEGQFVVLDGCIPAAYAANGYGKFVDIVDVTTLRYRLDNDPGAFVSGYIWPHIGGGGKLFITGTGVSKGNVNVNTANDAEFVIGRAALSTTRLREGSLLLSVYHRQTIGSYAVKNDRYNDHYVIATGPKGQSARITPSEFFTPGFFSPNWAALGGTPGSYMPYPGGHTIAILPHTWYTFKFHIKIGHWSRHNIVGWKVLDIGSGRDTTMQPVYASSQIDGSGKTTMRVTDAHTIHRIRGGAPGVFPVYPAAPSGFRPGARVYAVFGGVGLGTPNAHRQFLTITNATETDLTVAEAINDVGATSVNLYPVATVSDDGDRETLKFVCLSGFGDADILGPDPVNYPGNTGLPDDPGPVTLINCTDWVSGTNPIFVVMRKVDQSTYRVKGWNGTAWTKRAATGATLMVTGAKRLWRDSTVEFFIAADGDAMQRITVGNIDSAEFPLPVSGEHGWDVTNAFATAPCAEYPQGLMYGATAINNFLNNRIWNGYAGQTLERTDDAYIWADEILVSTRDIADTPRAVGTTTTGVNNQ